MDVQLVAQSREKQRVRLNFIESLIDAIHAGIAHFPMAKQ